MLFEARASSFDNLLFVNPIESDDCRNYAAARKVRRDVGQIGPGVA